MKISCKRLTDTAKAPEFQSAGAAGADLYADNDQPIILHPGERVLVPTNIILSIPDGYEGQIRSRSGLAHKYGISVLNSPGTIDSDFRGSVKVLLINGGVQSRDTIVINRGDRIAQLVIAKVERPEYIETETMDTTERAEKGWGSSGGHPSSSEETALSRL